MKHTALSLISIILKRALKTVDYCLNKDLWQESGVYTAAMMEDFVRLFREALSKVGAQARPGLPRYASRAFLPGVTGKHTRWKRRPWDHRGDCQVKWSRVE